jgi:hypothetical protein
MFRSVDLEEYMQTVETLAFPPALRREWDGLDHGMIFRGDLHDDGLCTFHEGDLHVAGNFRAPAANVLVLGDLVVGGQLETSCHDADEGGCFIVTGSVETRVLLNRHEKTMIVGGDLTAKDMLFNAFEHTLLYVACSLSTYFYYGLDIWAEFGVRADMEFGIGYCLPLGYTAPGLQAVYPRFDAAHSLRRLALPAGKKATEENVLAMIRSGRPLFR